VHAPAVLTGLSGRAYSQHALLMWTPGSRHDCLRLTHDFPVLQAPDCKHGIGKVKVGVCAMDKKVGVVTQHGCCHTQTCTVLRVLSSNTPAVVAWVKLIDG
jgi:hypothetical protein